MALRKLVAAGAGLGAASWLALILMPTAPAQDVAGATACIAIIAAASWHLATMRCDLLWSEDMDDLTDECVTAEAQRDQLMELIDAARTDIQDAISDRPEHVDQVIDYLTSVLDDGSMSVRAQNRARAGLRPDQANHETNQEV